MDGDLSVWNTIFALERQHLDRSLERKARHGAMPRTTSLFARFFGRGREARAEVVEATPVHLRGASGA